MNGFLDKAYRTVFPESWCCAIRFGTDSQSTILNDVQTPFTVLNNTRRYWTADPFLFEYSNRIYLFFEVFDRLKRKGLLGYREITDGNIGDIRIIYEDDFHLSYPFIFQNGEQIKIIPESNKSGELFELECVSFPDKWKKGRTLLYEKLADTTVFNYEGVNYYLTERVDDSNCFDRLDLFYSDNGAIKECANNPVKTDAATARCAGKVIYEDGVGYIRPSQDCGKAYGEKLNFNRIVSLSPQHYEEETFSCISHKDIILDRKNSFTGIHTYNRLGNVEVIDLKTKHRFNLLNFIGIFYKLFAKLLKRGS